MALNAASECILFALGSLLLFVLLRTLLRRDALAIAALAVVLIGPNGFGVGESAWLAVPISIVVMVTWILLLLRFGLLAAWIGEFVYEVLYVFPITTDLASWKAAPTLVGAAAARASLRVRAPQQPRRHGATALPRARADLAALSRRAAQCERR